MFHTFSFLSCHFSSSSFFFFFLTFLFASCFFCFFCSREREREREKRAVSHKEFLSQKKEKKLAKLYHKPTTYFSNPLKPSPRIQKKYKKTSLRARDISSVYFQLHAITSVQYSE